MSLIDSITKGKLLADGMQFTVSLSETDGTENSTATSAVISIIRNERDADVVVVDAEAMDAFDDSTFIYDWVPTSADALAGRYIVKFEITYPSDLSRIYDEFEVVSTTNNSIYLNLPIEGPTLKTAGGGNSWDNSQRPGSVNLGSNITE